MLGQSRYHVILHADYFQCWNLFVFTRAFKRSFERIKLCDRNSKLQVFQLRTRDPRSETMSFLLKCCSMEDHPWTNEILLIAKKGRCKTKFILCSNFAQMSMDLPWWKKPSVHICGEMNFFVICRRACSDRLKVKNYKADNQNLKLHSLGPGIHGRKSRLLSSLLKCCSTEDHPYTHVLLLITEAVDVRETLFLSCSTTHRCPGIYIPGRNHRFKFAAL
jgi:hypothetical protein